MKMLNQFLAVGGVIAALVVSETRVAAQGGFGGGGGGVVLSSPARTQQQTERLRLALGVTNDADWVVILPRISKVLQLQAEVRLGAFANMARGMAGAGGMRGLAAAAGTADPATDDLNKALDDDAPIAEIKSAMAKVRQARKAKQADLIKAQSDLQSVVTIRQEAILLNDGLLD
jgi:hypothetical protein